MITTGCQKCDEIKKKTGLKDLTILCDDCKLEYYEHCALVAVDDYLDLGLDGDESDYKFRKAKWRQQRKRLANLLRQIELGEIKESEVENE